jgi:hypothetical protein
VTSQCPRSTDRKVVEHSLSHEEIQRGEDDRFCFVADSLRWCSPSGRRSDDESVRRTTRRRNCEKGKINEDGHGRVEDKVSVVERGVDWGEYPGPKVLD